MRFFYAKCTDKENLSLYSKGLDRILSYQTIQILVQNVSCVAKVNSKAKHRECCDFFFDLDLINFFPPFS